MTTNCKHWAYCPETGEVLGSTTVNGLRRHIRSYVAWYIANGYPKKSWRFYHGAYEGLSTKALQDREVSA